MCSIITIWFFLMRFIEGILQAETSCTFPIEWNGTWVGSSSDGFHGPIIINETTLGDNGACFKEMDSSSGQFITFHEERNCFYCLKIYDRHINVLQLRYGRCEMADNGAIVGKMSPPNNFCSLENDTNIFHPRIKTLTRMNTENNIECPFYGETFRLQQRTGSRENKSSCSEKSQMLSCMTSNQVAFYFDQCDVGQAASGKVSEIAALLLDNQNAGIETLTCQGNWTDGINTYLVGFLKEPFINRPIDQLHCFSYRVTNDGYELIQSIDASCYRLHETTGNHRIINLKRRESQNLDRTVHCNFPSWAVKIGKFNSFSFTSRYEFSPDGKTMSVSNYSYTSGKSTLTSETRCVRIIGSYMKDESVYENAFSGENVKMVAEVVAGCKRRYKCLMMYFRTNNIIELQEGVVTERSELACSDNMMDIVKLPYITLIKAELEYLPCLAGGYHNVTDLDLKGTKDSCANSAGFQEISIRCDSPEQILFYRNCENEGKTSMFNCLGGWEEQIPLSDLTISTETFYDYGGNNEYRPLFDSYKYDPFRKKVYSNNQPNEIDFVDMEDNENATFGYMIAIPVSESKNAPRRVCFIYTTYNNTFSWTVDTQACLRNIRPGQVGKFKFNTTRTEMCGASHFHPAPVFALLTVFKLRLHLWLS